LIAEDDKDGRRSVTEAVSDAGFEVIAVATGEEAVAEFQRRPFDVVLTDLMLPGMDGMAVLAEVRKVRESVPVLIMTAYGTVSSAVQALKAGAYDYILKPLDLEDLQSKVARAAEASRLRAEVSRLSETIGERWSARAMIARSPKMQEIIRQVETVADSNATTLILGESGTGKELVARALHVGSKRRSGPFVAVNCGAFAETLLESELFGHEKGAFTGAVAQRKGAFERADGGTLFLDEIGNAPPSVQMKLLRVLEERELLRVGGQAPVRVDTRVVSASNRDLDDLVASNEFRSDLLYRLKVVTIRLPPLRERKEDIRPMVDRFVAMACEEHGRHINSVAPDFYAALEKCDWPGNVRQLKNVIESSVVTATGPDLAAANAEHALEPDRAPAGLAFPGNATLAEMERTILLETLRRNDGNRTLSAEKLGISRRTIQRKIKEYNLPF